MSPEGAPSGAAARRVLDGVVHLQERGCSHESALLEASAHARGLAVQRLDTDLVLLGTGADQMPFRGLHGPGVSSPALVTLANRLSWRALLADRGVACVGEAAASRQRGELQDAAARVGYPVLVRPTDPSADAPRPLVASGPPELMDRVREVRTAQKRRSFVVLEPHRRRDQEHLVRVVGAQGVRVDPTGGGPVAETARAAIGAVPGLSYAAVHVVGGGSGQVPAVADIVPVFSAGARELDAGDQVAIAWAILELETGHRAAAGGAASPGPASRRSGGRLAHSVARWRHARRRRRR